MTLICNFVKDNTGSPAESPCFEEAENRRSSGKVSDYDVIKSGAACSDYLIVFL